MAYWAGLFLVASGLLSLVCNEFAVQIRRIWAWRRDDSDVLCDAKLNEYYRLSVYIGSVVAVEMGQLIAGFDIGHWLLRAVVYALFGGWLLWKRPALRSRQFWKSVVDTT